MEWWQLLGAIAIYAIVAVSFWYSEDGEEF
jgi:hypothetical protein